MDYYHKYIKYKLKYLHLKYFNTQYGGIEKLLVYSMNAQQQFTYFLNVIKCIPFFKQYNYNVILPDHSSFNSLYKNPELLDTINKESLFPIFEKEIYISINTTPLETILTENKEIILSFFEKLKILHHNWNFLICNEYAVIPVIWSPGGTYEYDSTNNSASILIKTDENGIPSSKYKSTLETICHEIVHIGIEDCIVKKLHLSHSDKECTVDMIMSIYLHDLFPSYKLQTQYINKIFIEHIDKQMIEQNFYSYLQTYLN